MQYKLPLSLRRDISACHFRSELQAVHFYMFSVACTHVVLTVTVSNQDMTVSWPALCMVVLQFTVASAFFFYENKTKGEKIPVTNIFYALSLMLIVIGQIVMVSAVM